MEKIEDIIEDLNTHHWKPEKSRTALLLIDCQEYFRPLLEPILGNLSRVLSAFRSAGRLVIFTRHGHPPQEQPGMINAWWNDIIPEGKPSSCILPELSPKDKEIILPKTRYDAFYHTDLEDILRSHQIQDVIIGGVMTNLCCETTARAAFVRDFRVFFLADGTATASMDMHTASLKNLAFGFAVLYSCRRIAREFSPVSFSK